MIVLWLKLLHVCISSVFGKRLRQPKYVYHVKAIQKRTSLVCIFPSFMLNVFVDFFLSFSLFLSLSFWRQWKSFPHTYTQTQEQWEKHHIVDVVQNGKCAVANHFIYSYYLLCVLRTLNIFGAFMNICILLWKNLWTYNQNCPVLVCFLSLSISLSLCLFLFELNYYRQIFKLHSNRFYESL